MKRVWYWPAWKLTNPMKVAVWGGGDEFNRRTTCFSLGLFGTFIFAHEGKDWNDWITDAVERKLLAGE